MNSSLSHLCDTERGHGDRDARWSPLCLHSHWAAETGMTYDSERSLWSEGASTPAGRAQPSLGWSVEVASLGLGRQLLGKAAVAFSGAGVEGPGRQREGPRRHHLTSIKPGRLSGPHCGGWQSKGREDQSPDVAEVVPGEGWCSACAEWVLRDLLMSGPKEQWLREARDSEIAQGAVRGPPRAHSRPAGRWVPEGAERQAGRRRPGMWVATWTEPRELG